MPARMPQPTVPPVRAARAEDLMAVLPAVPPSLPRARELLRGWLAAQRWPAEQAADVVLAVNEAIANAIDHAYPPAAPGSAHLHAWVSVEPQTGDRRVVAAINDHGGWDPAYRSTTHADHRGNGLVLISACMDELHVQRSAGGTSVILISPAVPRAA